jgi:hypothetical protein
MENFSPHITTCRKIASIRKGGLKHVDKVFCLFISALLFKLWGFSENKHFRVNAANIYHIKLKYLPSQ